MNDSPWYKRSEFWMALIPAILGIIAQASDNPHVQAIGAAFAGASPTTYVHGRNKVKSAKAAKPNG